MNPVEFTGWWFTDAVRQVSCPRCGAEAGFPCRQPKGRKQWPPHTERTIAIAREVGSVEPWQGSRALKAWKERYQGGDSGSI